MLLGKGEYLEGELTRIGEGRVTVSSVLFGLRSYDLEGEVLAVVLHPPARPRIACEVETVDGSTWLGSGFSIGENELWIQEPLLGVVRLPAYQLREIRRR